MSIPAGIYYSIDSDNFYSVEGHQGQGLEFYRLWRSRIPEFPKRVGFGAILTAEQHTVHRDLMALLIRARALGVVVQVDLLPMKPLAMGNYYMRGSVRPARERANG